MRHACLASWRGKTIWGRFYSRFGSAAGKILEGSHVRASYILIMRHLGNPKLHLTRDSPQKITWKITLGMSLTATVLIVSRLATAHGAAGEDA
jgi:hypothetical protein